MLDLPLAAALLDAVPSQDNFRLVLVGATPPLGLLTRPYKKKQEPAISVSAVIWRCTCACR